MNDAQLLIYTLAEFSVIVGCQLAAAAAADW